MEEYLIAEEIQQLQRNCSNHVTEQAIETIRKILDEDNYFYLKNSEGKIVVSIYRIPLLNNISKDKQIYRIGGLSILSKKYIKEFILVLENSFSENLILIMKTDNPSVAKKLLKLGAEELNYKDTLEKYPDFLNAYIRKSKKDVKYYETQKFYIRKRG